MEDLERYRIEIVEPTIKDFEKNTQKGRLVKAASAVIVMPEGI